MSDQLFFFLVVLIMAFEAAYFFIILKATNRAIRRNVLLFFLLIAAMIVTMPLNVIVFRLLAGIALMFGALYLSGCSRKNRRPVSIVDAFTISSAFFVKLSIEILVFVVIFRRQFTGLHTVVVLIAFIIAVTLLRPKIKSLYNTVNNCLATAESFYLRFLFLVIFISAQALLIHAMIDAINIIGR